MQSITWITLENRKKNTKLVCDNIHELIKDIPYIFTIFVICHAVLIIIIINGLLFKKVGSIYFAISLTMLLVQIITNLYFNGCILTKIERKMVGKWWYGFPYTQLLKNPTPFKVNSIMWGVMSSLLFFSLFKINHYMSP